jgi:hypothetical protein
MKKDKETKADKRLRQAEKALRSAERNRRLAIAERDKARVKYAAARPLTEDERDELARAVAKGQALCCDAGRKWLRRRLPEPWAQAVNEWAYIRLSCTEKDPSWLENYAARVRKLELDRFPFCD